MHLVQVAFNLPLRREFCYSAASPVPVGVRVTADFGKRRLTGFVVDQPRTPPPGVSVRELHRVVDAQPLFDPGYLELAHWVRDRSRGEKMQLGEAVKSLTSDPANAYGLTDRGVVAAGKKADLNIIDLKHLRLPAPWLEYDLPAGNPRLLQRAEGYRATVKSGQVTFENSEHTGAFPGTVLRRRETTHAAA